MAVAPAKSRAIQLFEPPRDAIYTIEATSRLVNVSRHKPSVGIRAAAVSLESAP
jgi:hypothetical protein